MEWKTLVAEKKPDQNFYWGTYLKRPDYLLKKCEDLVQYSTADGWTMSP